MVSASHEQTKEMENEKISMKRSTENGIKTKMK